MFFAAQVAADEWHDEEQRRSPKTQKDGARKKREDGFQDKP